jgi:hypothetical protein
VPLLAGFFAKRGLGKTTTATRLLKSYMDASVFMPEWVFVISPTAPSQRHLFSYLGISDGNVYTSNLKPAIDAILERMTAGKQAWDIEQEYEQAYQMLMQMPSALTPRQISILESRNGIPPRRTVTYPRSCVLIDDASHQKNGLNAPWFVNLALRHRHVCGGAGLSMIICVQSLHQGISRSIRQNLSFIAVWATHDKTCKEDLFKEVSAYLSKETFFRIFHEATRDPHNFLGISLSERDPNKVFTLSLEQPIKVI